jgi:hypothetical protein
MKAYRQCYINLYKKSGYCMRIGGKRKSDFYLELYKSVDYLNNSSEIKRSAQMTLEMMKLYFIKKDDIENLERIYTELSEIQGLILNMFLTLPENLELSIGENMLDMATYFRSEKIINWLLKLKTDPICYNSQGISAISRAIETGNTNLVKKYTKNKNLTLKKIKKVFDISSSILNLFKIQKHSIVYNIYKTKLDCGLQIVP